MAFTYVRHNSPFLRQGEIIDNLFEFKLQIPAQESIDYVRKRAKFDPISHPSVIVVSQDCDLEWDYKARFEGASVHKLIAHILCCSLFSRYEITDETKQKSRMFELLKQNQDERYYYLAEAPVNGTEDTLPEMVADFKTVFSLPTEFVYWLVSTGQAIRKGGLLSPYLEHFMDRLYHFLGRVATPE